MRNVILFVFLLASSTGTLAGQVVFGEVRSVNYKEKVKGHQDYVEISIVGDMKESGFSVSSTSEMPAYHTVKLRFQTDKKSDRFSFKACLDFAIKALDPSFGLVIASDTYNRVNSMELLLTSSHPSNLECHIGRRN